MRKQLLGFLLAVLWAAFCMPAQAETEITLTFGGDCVLGTREEWVGRANNYEACVAEKGLDWSFGALASLFAEDDLTLINLECVLQNGNEGHNHRKQHTFRGKPEYAAMLPSASVELVNVANNHFVDYGASGKRSTLAALEAAGVPSCGYGSLYVLEAGGVKIGFGGCRESEFLAFKPTVYREIQQLKKLGCEVIVYSCHWGKEYSPTHNKVQERMAQYAVNSGADIVVGTHPHVVQGVEARASSDGTHSALVLYSLGNLVFGGTHELQTFDALLARVTLRFDDDSRYLGAALTLLPVLSSGDAPRNDFRPVLAEGEDAERILRLAQDDSAEELSDEMWFAAQ